MYVALLMLTVGQGDWSPVRAAPVSHGLDIPRVRHDLTVECDCPISGVCRCSVCACGEAGYNAVYARAERERIPLVVFVGVPRRDVAGCATIGLPKWCTDSRCFIRNIIVVHPWDHRFGNGQFTFWALPAGAGDAEIRGVDRPAVTSTIWRPPPAWAVPQLALGGAYCPPGG